MKTKDIEKIEDARELQRKLKELTNDRQLVCSSNPKHTKYNVIQQDKMTQQLKICVKCRAPLIAPSVRTRVSWVDLCTDLVEIEGEFFRVDGQGEAEPEEELAALAAHLLHRHGVDLARIEAALDTGKLEGKFSVLCAQIRQGERDLAGILYPTSVAHDGIPPACQPSFTAQVQDSRGSTVVNLLCKLLPSQMGLYIFKWNLDASELSNGSQAQRALDVVQALEVHHKMNVACADLARDFPGLGRELGGPSSITHINTINVSGPGATGIKL